MLKKFLAAGMLVLIASSNYAQNNENQSTTHNTLNNEKMEASKSELQSFTQYQEVEKALQPYIESAKSGDGDLSRSAFYDHAHIIGSIDGEYENVNAEQFGANIAALGPAKEIQHHIAWIDISGPAAAAKVEFFNWLGFRFTDFFVLYKKEGQWKISGKVYDSHSRN